MDAREPKPRFFASASRGTEEVLAEELAQLGIGTTAVGRGGVEFGVRLEDAYRACLWSRVASRVLMPLASFDAPDADALYHGVAAIEWTDHITADRTLAVTVAGSDALAGPSHFLTLKTKDAIVDRVRDAEGRRPNVDKQAPDVAVHVHTRGSRITVSLDLAGRGLHHRGRARPGAEAPLKENLAAALLRMTGWPGDRADRPLFDPLCGSAGLLLEAAAMALDLAPGLTRGHTGLAGWRGHDARLWQALCDEARERAAAARDLRLRIAGTDASQAAVRAARALISQAGLERHVRVDPGELALARPPWTDPGIVVTNPPYGERLGETGELGPLYELLGDVLRRRFPGWTAWVLSGNPALAKRIGLRPASRREVFNGPIRCRWLEIPVATEPPVRRDGPGWRRAPTDEARGFARRLAGNAEKLAHWAAKERIDAYRVYDADVPEFNFAIDRYGRAVRVEEYAPPAKVAPEDAERRRREALQVVAEVLEVEPTNIVLRVRRRLGKHEQHARFGDRGRFLAVREGRLRFRVNLTDYLDTGLFLDDRSVRRRILERARGRDMLNLFAYTCSASVAAAAGGARSTTSVDLSRGYLEWGRGNFELNRLPLPRQHFERADALRWLATSSTRYRQRYGLILVAPPVRSRSKAMTEEFDVERDHPRLLRLAARKLADDGEMLFATSRRRFELRESELALVTREARGLEIREITSEVTPRDFARRPRLRVWTLKLPRRR